MKLTLLLFATAAAVTAQSPSSAPVSATATACQPHGDHWHCPSGIPEPTTPPALPASNTISAPAASGSHAHDDEHDDHDHEASTCEPHGDHWDCPSGVAQPSTRPAGVSATTTAPAVSQSTGGAARVGAGVVAVVGGVGVGAWLL